MLLPPPHHTNQPRIGHFPVKHCLSSASGFLKPDMFSCISPESVTAPARPGIAHSKLRAVFRLTLRIVRGKYAQTPENARPGHPGRHNSGIIAKRKEPES